jgi:hypothetical protein
VAEDCAVAAGEDGSHEAGVEVRGAVAYGVDALVDAVESPSLRALCRCLASDPNGFELPKGDYSVLA